MTKRLIHVIIILAIILIGAACYLWSLIMPVKIYTLLTEEMEKATGKSILIEAVHFNIFKGLVLDDVIIYDAKSIIVWAKRVSCGIPLATLFQQKVDIPSIEIDSAAIYFERRADNSVNIMELIPKKYEPSAAVAIALRRIRVKNTRVIFIDRTVAPVFKERIDDVTMDIRLSLPDTVAMDLSCNIPLAAPISLKFSGVYTVSDASLAGRIHVKGLVLSEFRDYYKEARVTFPSGTLDADADLRISGGDIAIDLDGDIKNLRINKDTLSMKIDSGVTAMATYNINEKFTEYAGKLDVRSMDIQGIEGVGKLENIKANIEFNDSRVWSEDILVDAYGMRWKSKVNIVNFNRPIVDIYADSAAHLSVIQKMLKDEFRITLPTDIAGKADIRLAIQMSPENPVKMNGGIKFHDATISLGAGNFPIESMNGEAHFDLEGAAWSKISLKYREVPYIVSGRLADFAAPRVQLQVASRDLQFDSAFSARGSRIAFSDIKGRYLTSLFSMNGDIDLAAKNVVDADIKGDLTIRLADVRKMVKNSAGLQKMKPRGTITAAFSLNGNANDLRSCEIKTRAKAGSLSVYGLKMTDITMDYAQKQGSGQIKSMKALFYGGSLFATAKIDWFGKGLPYSVNFDAKDVKLEDLKMVTGFKDKDVSGKIMALASLAGTFRDITKFSGTGRISIRDGRLWQLNLLQGVGKMIFSSDFADLVFTEGSCDLELKDRGLLIKSFALKSGILDLYGSGMIGADKSITAIVQPEIKASDMDETKERIATAVSSNTVIKITGTVDNPQFTAQANFAEVVGGIANAIFRK